MKANLIVTFDPSRAGKAMNTIKNLVDADVVEAKDGIALLKTGDDPKGVVRQLSEKCRETPQQFESTFYWTPVEKWCSADMGELEDAMKEVDKRIDSAKTWKIDINKRSFAVPTNEMIEKLTAHIDKPNVDLKNPDQIVRVDIVGDMAAVSLLQSSELLNVRKFMKE